MNSITEPVLQIGSNTFGGQKYIRLENKERLVGVAACLGHDQMLTDLQFIIAKPV